MHKLARLDHRYIWHPFTQMRDWLRHEPTVIVAGAGAVLYDVEGREYLDGNSSIWTNLHGHNHPRLDAALRRQLGRIAHSSALGLANEPAALLAERLVRAARWPAAGGPRLTKVFFSDDGSTAVEVALKLAYQHALRSGGPRKPRFLAVAGGYHGDTIGAASLGHIPLFEQAYGGLLFKSDEVMAPYCYRCRFNRATPERADAREYRRCRWECVDQVEARFAARRRRGGEYAAMVVEPLIQGAAGMIPQPNGWLRRVAAVARAHDAQIIADEVLTGFGRAAEARTGATASRPPTRRLGPGSRQTESPVAKPGGPLLFACASEGVRPDFLALAKGLTGGYLPMGATLTTDAVFGSFLGEYKEFRTFFHGHSFTANQLGAAAANASLELLETTASRTARSRLAEALEQSLPALWTLAHVGDVRRVGLIVGVELVEDWRKRRPYPLAAQAGIRVCEAMKQRGVLTRPIGNVVVLMPPYCTTPSQARRMIAALGESVDEALGQ